MAIKNMNNQVPQGLDPTAFYLTKSIRQAETSGSKNAYTTPGKSGEYGAYQYTEPTWNGDSQKYLGKSVRLQDATPEQQNQVAYSKVADLLKQGKTQSQVASIWNSNDPEAYKGTFSTNSKTHKVGDSSSGKNSYGAVYNVPQYVDSVKKVYQQYMTGIQQPTAPSNPSSITGDNQIQNSGQQTNQIQDNRPTLKEKVVGMGKEVLSGGEALLGKLAGNTPGQEGLASKLNSLSDTNNAAYQKTLPPPTTDRNGNSMTDDKLTQFSTGVASSEMWLAKQLGDALGIKMTGTGQKIYDKSQSLDEGTSKDIGKVVPYAMPALAGGAGALLGGGAGAVDAAGAATKMPGLLKLLFGYEAGKGGIDFAKGKLQSLWDKYVGSQVPNQGETTTINGAPLTK